MSHPKMSYWHFKPDSWLQAQTGGCRDRIWLDLSKLREPSVRRSVPYGQRNPRSDESMEKTAAFAGYLASLCLRHKPKRNLMKCRTNSSNVSFLEAAQRCSPQQTEGYPDMLISSFSSLRAAMNNLPSSQIQKIQ